MYSQVVGNALIVALRNEKGSYNRSPVSGCKPVIVALRNEKGSYNDKIKRRIKRKIVALRNEKGSYNVSNCHFI